MHDTPLGERRGNMVDEGHNTSQPQLSAEALQEWAQHVESVLQGIAHALNNRAAALSAVLELASDPDSGSSATGILGTELGRLQELVNVVRLIGTEHGANQAFQPHDAANEALAILQLHSGQRERNIAIDSTSTTPVRVPRWMFVRALVSLAAAAWNGTPEAPSAVRISLLADGDWLVARAEGSTALASSSPYMSELVRAMGGTPLSRELGFRIPTLAALRQREDR